jgi:hypothetical protein
MPAIEVGAKDDFNILGVVAGVFRPFHEQLPALEPLLADEAAEAALAETGMPAVPMPTTVS